MSLTKDQALKPIHALEDAVKQELSTWAAYMAVEPQLNESFAAAHKAWMDAMSRVVEARVALLNLIVPPAERASEAVPA